MTLLPWQDRLGEALGGQVGEASPLSGGCVGEVYRVRLVDGREVVAKVGRGSGDALDVEGRMLCFLARESSLPVPEVLHSSPDLLVMEWIPSGGRAGNAEVHAAELLAALHEVRGPAFGLDFDTLIGGLPQANPWTDSWVEFFRRHRLEAMADQALEAGRLPAGIRNRLGRLGENLGDWLEEPGAPSLLHGDVWSGNVLVGGAGVAAFLDPAIYFGHAEIELAFVTMFGTFGSGFFLRYQELREIRPGFFETRRDLYNLYPLLVHVRLFGGGYLSGVESTLARFGF